MRILDRPQQYVSNLLEEDKSSPQPERHRRELVYPHQGPEHHDQGLKIPHQEPERHHQRLERYRKKLQRRHHDQELHFLFRPERHLSAASPGVESFTPDAVTPNAPQHEAASMTPDPSIEEMFDSMHAKRESGTDPPATCVDFAYMDRDSFRISGEENLVIKIPNRALRYHPSPGATSPRIIGSSTSEVSGASASRIIEASGSTVG